MILNEQLTILESLPTGILELEATDLHRCLDGPTLIHLPGRSEPAVFVSALLHGNEHSSWQAVRELLKEYQNKELPRALSIFIGNVRAAKFSQRFLDDQQDFNRLWGEAGRPAAPLMQQVTNEMEARGVFLSVDIHNNTGKNPHYGCINRLEPEFLYLASLFSRTLVYFLKPASVQSMAFSRLCPAVTVECGLSADAHGTEHALEFLRACIHLSEFPSNPAAVKDVIVYHTVAIMKFSADYSLGFDDPEAEVDLNSELEYYNFRRIEAGTSLGRLQAGVRNPVSIVSELGCEVEDDYLAVQAGELVCKKPLVPAMITKDIDVIRKDCFCYLMEEYPLNT